MSDDKSYCFGYCVDCGCEHALPSARAIPYAQKLMHDLRTHGRLDFESPVADPRCSTAVLYGEERGKMFGVLVCEDGHGNEVVLKAFSCQHDSLWTIPGWVPPVVDTSVFDPIAAEASVRVHALNDRISTLPSESEEREGLKNERRLISQRLVEELRALYVLRNFKGEERPLALAFEGVRGIPWGTGDCCAPKLLQEAAKRGLKPKAMVEFFFGRENSSGTRREGQFYPACEERCQPILGFMLCGADDA